MKKNPALITIIISILFLTFIMSPVTALPKTNNQFQENISLVAGNVYQGTQATQAGILYVTNGVSTGTVSKVSGLDLTGTIWTKLSGYYDTSTGNGMFQGKWVITTTSGTFSGSVNGHIATIDPYTFKVQGNCVGFGDGAYKGDRIKGSFAGNTISGTLVVNIQIIGSFSDKT